MKRGLVLVLLSLLIAPQAFGAAEFGKVRNPAVLKVFVFKAVPQNPTQMLRDAHAPEAPMGLSPAELSTALRANGFSNSSEMAAPDLTLTPGDASVPNRGWLFFGEPVGVWGEMEADLPRDRGRVRLTMITKPGTRYLMDWSVLGNFGGAHSLGVPPTMTYSVTGAGGTQASTVPSGSGHILAICAGDASGYASLTMTASQPWKFFSVTVTELH